MIRRRNYFIKKRFQLNFVYKFVILLLLEALLIAGLFMYLSNDTLTTGYLGSILRVESTPRFFFAPLVLITLIVCVGIGIAAMIVFILLSHKIAGPLYRFENDLREIAGGDLTKRICLRKTDQLIELKEALNLLIGSLDRKVGRMKDIVLELEGLTYKEDIPSNLDKIYKLIEILKNEINCFKVTSEPKE